MPWAALELDYFQPLMLKLFCSFILKFRGDVGEFSMAEARLQGLRHQYGHLEM